MLAMRLLVLSAFAAGLAAAGQQGADSQPMPETALKATVVSREEMVKFVEEAAAFVGQIGKDAALKEFSNPKGKFVRANGELYIYAYALVSG